MKRAIKLVDEFKEFAVKGNMIDMAIGIIIGAAFSTVVKSLVDDVIMPVVGKMTGGVDFSDLFVTLGSGDFMSIEAAKEAGVATINYGLFINSLITFLIVAWVLFFVIKAMNKLKREEPTAEPTHKDCAHCCSSIKIKAKKCPHCTSEV